ncbi:MAG: hypothetical protein AAGA85_07170 [Bacteroidota bacterium]
MVLIIGVVLFCFGAVVSLLAVLDFRNVEGFDLNWGKFNLISFALSFLALGAYLIHSA